MTRSTVQPITNIEREKDGFKYNTKLYLDKIAIIMNNPIHIITNNIFFHIIPIEESKDFILEYRNSTLNNNLLEPGSDSKSTSINFYNNNNEATPDTVGDTYLNSEIALPRIGHNHPQLARVSKRIKNFDGNLVGMANTNPILDTRQYLVEFLDEHEEAIHTNLTADHMYAQVDEESRQNFLLDETVDHRCDPNLAVSESDSYLSSNTGQKSRIRTIEGWDVLLSWKDGSTDWIPLKELKESYPVEISEYSLQKNISHHPAFVWRVNHVVQIKKIMISKIKSLYW